MDEDLLAVLAHGWLNSMAVVAGNAQTVRDLQHRLPPEIRTELLLAAKDQADFLVESFKDLLQGAAEVHEPQVATSP
jgi:K+-sensing histidine kinase KdpD